MKVSPSSSVLLFATVILLVIATATTTNALYEEDAIKCKVCYHAIRHMWNRGAERRQHCKHPDNETAKNDHCHLSNLNHDGIIELVNGTCEEMPRRYQHLHNDSGFDIFVTDNPKHDAEVVDIIQSTCKKFIHDEHSVEKVALAIYGNLDAGKDSVDILFPLSHRFCQKPCNLAPPKKRKRQVARNLDIYGEGGRPEEHEFILKLHEERMLAAEEEAKKKKQEEEGQQQKAATEEEVQEEDDEF